MLKSSVLAGSTCEDYYVLVRYAMQYATNLTTCRRIHCLNLQDKKWRQYVPPKHW